VQTYAIIAEEAAPAPAGEEERPGSGYGIFIMMGLIFVVFYMLLIRPQRKKEKDRQRQRQEMLGNLERNDHILTIGGIHGVVVSVGEQEVTIKIDEKADVKMRVSRDAISKVVGKDDEGAGEEGGTTLGDRSDAGR